MADTVSGPLIAEQIRARIPTAGLVELPDVGHYPQIEVPQRVAEEIATTFSVHGG
jgi:pimeloyl-ACP methyl ester carboxylesterase